MEDKLFLGKALYAEKTFARLEPLAYESNGHWVAIQDKAALFPPDGKVFSTRPLHGASKDGILTFRRRANERLEEGKDHYLVDDAREAIPILNFSTLSIEEARKRLFNQGVAIASPYKQVCALVIVADRLFCDLDLKQCANGLWKAESASAPVPLMAVPEEWANLGTLAGLDYLPAEEVPSTHPVKFVSWCSDQEFVERVLERFRKHSRNLVDTKYGRLSKESVQYIARALERAELMPGSDDDVELNLERLRADWPVLEARISAAEELSELVLGSNAAKDILDVAVGEAERRASEAIRPEVEQRVRVEVESSLADVVAQRNEVAADTESKLRQLMSLNEELKNIEERCAQGREEQQAFSRNLTEVLKGLSAAFEDMSPLEQPFAKTVLDRLEQAIEGGLGQRRNLIPSNVAPWARRFEVQKTGSIEYSGLATRIEAEAKTHAVATEDLSLVDALARSGELILMFGPQAELALTAYARCVAGGAVRSLPVDPSVIGLEDLWRVPGTQQPTALAYAWNSAEAEPDRLHIVCLRNLDAAPFHLWLASLNAVLFSASRPRNLLFFATSTGREQTQTAAPCNDASYQRWLIPIQAGVHRDGPAAVLASMISPLDEPTRLHFLSSAPSDDTISIDWLKRIALLNATPEFVMRMTRLAQTVLCSGDEQIRLKIFNWAEYITSSVGPETLPPCMRAGYASLDSLAQSH
ncbi:hypothetical protein N0A02_13505 [Paraburkholderia acidicola]|jgi:hypothetical protein|uniref:Uncharacterized protein n=1 Tax=Paraburkholderia acidicola TaxID=1912599 RepID=A0ABV1LMI4_9BURK